MGPSAHNRPQRPLIFSLPLAQDTFLSVLPLYHALELTCGLPVPLARPLCISRHAAWHGSFRTQPPPTPPHLFSPPRSGHVPLGAAPLPRARADVWPSRPP